IAAAEIAGADAIHPGYGFLAENAEFAETCIASNISFIGPTPTQIRVMGDKAAARKAMTEVGVPIIPGTPGGVEDPDDALRFAREIGFPVIIKAAAGGGGKGMRVATDPEDFGRSFQLARSEALSAFGDGEVYIEKYLLRPRYIEFQIMGDRHGRVIHHGERDCSVQRRHQKLMEEAPSPAMTPELREKMGEAAVKGAKANVYAGYSVPPFYDSPLAKLICQGCDRPEALRRMQVALESFIIEGVTTTIPFLGRVMANKKFQEGAVDTKFLERESELMKEPASA